MSNIPCSYSWRWSEKRGQVRAISKGGKYKFDLI